MIFPRFCEDEQRFFLPLETFHFYDSFFLPSSNSLCFYFINILGYLRLLFFFCLVQVLYKEDENKTGADKIIMTPCREHVAHACTGTECDVDIADSVNSYSKVMCSDTDKASFIHRSF